jgi:2-polyprenyl-6-methoxyphenol hydroxylase-like FAD-dependent oxidoreductase
MTSARYDAIIVGARCAGAPTAMLLARAGYKVLLVDRSTFPSDTISTHVIHPQGVAALKRWGLLERLLATRCPPIHTYVFDFGPFAISGAPGTPDSPVGYCPRRTILDKLLVDGAIEAGVEVREGFVVEEVMRDDGVVTGIRGHNRDGTQVTEHARVVIGADGRNSLVAKAVDPAQYNERPEYVCAYYAYWSGLPMHGRFETYARPEHGFAAVETHDNLTLIVGGWPRALFETKKHDLEASYLALFDSVPEFAARVHEARRESKIFGAISPNFFRKPFGRGWALVGDAGYTKDPITAQGMSDAFRDAELLAAALKSTFAGEQSFDAALGAYQAARDASALPMYDFTCQIAAMQPPPPEFQQLLGAVHGNQDAMDGFCRVNAGITSPAEFFSEANVGKIFAAAAAR